MERLDGEGKYFERNFNLPLLFLEWQNAHFLDNLVLDTEKENFDSITLLTLLLFNFPGWRIWIHFLLISKHTRGSHFKKPAFKATTWSQMLVNSTFQLLPRPRVIELILICEYCSNLLRLSRHKSPQLESALTELGFINSGILSEEESLYFPNTPSPSWFGTRSATSRFIYLAFFT